MGDGGNTSFWGGEGGRGREGEAGIAPLPKPITTSGRNPTGFDQGPKLLGVVIAGAPTFICVPSTICR